MLESLKYWMDSPLSWAIVGFITGIIFGVNTISIWIVTIGLIGFLVYLAVHGQASNKNEGWLFASWATFILGWITGFIIYGVNYVVV